MESIKYRFQLYPGNWMYCMHYIDESQIPALNKLTSRSTFAVDENYPDRLVRNEYHNGWFTPTGIYHRGYEEKHNFYKSMSLIEQCNFSTIALRASSFYDKYKDWEITSKYVFNGKEFYSKDFSTVYVAPSGYWRGNLWHCLDVYDEDKENFVFMADNIDMVKKKLSRHKNINIIELTEPIKERMVLE